MGGAVRAGVPVNLVASPHSFEPVSKPASAHTLQVSCGWQGSGSEQVREQGSTAYQGAGKEQGMWVGAAVRVGRTHLIRFHDRSSRPEGQL